MNPNRRSIIFYIVWIVCTLFPVQSFTQTASYYYEQAVRCRYQETEKLDSAIYYFELSAAIQQENENWDSVFEVKNRIARTLYQAKRVEESIAKSEEIIRESRKKLGADNYQEADAYIGLGLIYFKMKSQLAKKLSVDQPVKAAESFGSGVRIFEKLNYPLDEFLAECYFYLAISYEHLEQWNRAIPIYYKSLSYYKKNFRKYPEMRWPTRFSIENNLGELYTKTGHFQKAEEHLQQSVFFVQLWYPEKKWVLSKIYTHLGLLNESLQRFDKAELYFEKALDLGLAHFNDQPHKIAPLYNSLSTNSNQQKKYEDALAFSKKASNLIDLKNPSSVQLKNQLLLLENLAESYLGLGKYDLSLAKAEQALNLKAEIKGKDHFSSAKNYQHIGNVYMYTEEYVKARAAFFKAIPRLESFFGTHHPDLAKAYNSIVESFIQEGLYMDALHYSREALRANFPFFETAEQDYLQNPASLAYYDGIEALRSLELKAKTLLAKNKESYDQAQLDAVFHTFQKADSLIFKLRSFFQGDDQIAFNQLAHNVYEEAIGACHFAWSRNQDNRFLEEAFRYAESARQHTLLSEINAADALEIAGLPDSLVERERFLRLDISFWEQQLWLAGKKSDDARMTYCRNLIFEEKEAYEKLMEHLEKNYPDYFSLKYGLPSISLSEVHAMLDKNQALVEYFVGKHRIFVFTLANGKIDLREFSRPPELEFQINQFLRANSDYAFIRDSTSAAYSLFTQSGNQLFSTLIQPVLAQLSKKTKRLVIIPDGILHLIPFELLPGETAKAGASFRNYPYLVRRYAIAYWTSVTLNKQQEQRNKSSISQQQYGGFAPVYNVAEVQSPIRVFISQKPQRSPAQLPHAAEEIAACASLLEGDYYLGEKASKATFLSLASNYKILHLAMHGYINHEEPLQSFLLFDKAPDSLNYDRLLVSELYNAKVQADLVVLNACNTGRGKLEKGEGLMNMSRAFSYAGCPAVLMSLWSIPDASSSELTTLFFKYIKAGLTKDEALQQAKIEFLDNTVPNQTHPVYWAGITLVGDQEAVFDKKQWVQWLSLGLALLLFIFLFRKATTRIIAH